ncbi:hypothetical protein COY33_01375 [candidate division WWE3 bacterium CG_4_10_14_0_2_um_filter_42_7]|uniref:Type II toxin-antitoxin system antitoxin, RelB/DinJ family n=1 Tax=candidate division WWE3 bacterium CG_4_10_14_0_2_um_filter_42_7 TaxID=1975073 RepID=A0A2M7TDI1_UNCKA|nr:MAG: hypothetical protein COY33_01375 [candidate division WWE3 bacterium CG_4_10_14_0_2_um_filter_42_7]
MNTAIINVKTDPKVKAEAQEIAASLGFSLSSLINAYLKQLARTKAVSFDLVSYEPSDYLVKTIKKAEADRKAGRLYSFPSGKKALEFLDSVIDESNKS